MYTVIQHECGRRIRAEDEDGDGDGDTFACLGHRVSEAAREIIQSCEEFVAKGTVGIIIYFVSFAPTRYYTC